MAKKDRSPLKAGIFILVSIALIVAILIAIKGLSSLTEPMVARRAAFPLSADVGGLRVGDDVRVGGYKVGIVQNIAPIGLDEGQEPQNLIDFTIPKRYILRQHLHMAIQTTVTGSSVLNIDNLGHGDAIPVETTIEGQPSSYSRLIDSLGVAGPELTSFLRDLHTITMPKLDTAIDKGQITIAEIKDFAHRAALLASTLDDLFGDVTPDFRGTIANLNAVTGSAKAKLPGILDHIDDVVVKADAAVDNAKVALVSAKQAMASARDIISGNRGKLDAMIASLKSTSDNLKGASAEIRREPWRLLYKPHPGEIENEVLFDAARQFADGAESVNDAATALRDAMQSPNVDRQQVQKLMDQLDGAFANFNTVEHKLWTAVKD